MEWIKVCKDTPSKPELSILAEITHRSDDEALGIWLRLYLWLDSNSGDGYLSKMTIERLSKASKIPIDFCEAMASDDVGWFRVLPPTDNPVEPWGIEIANWKRHNGKSSKKRDQTAGRQQKFRKNHSE